MQKSFVGFDLGANLCRRTLNPKPSSSLINRNYYPYQGAQKPPLPNMVVVVVAVVVVVLVVVVSAILVLVFPFHFK